MKQIGAAYAQTRRPQTQLRTIAHPRQRVQETLAILAISGVLPLLLMVLAALALGDIG